MKRTVLNMILVSIMSLLPAATLAAPVYACGNSAAAQQVSNGIDETSNASCDASGVNKAISVAVNILTLVVGAAAVFSLIWSGFKYITSGGDANKVANAKSTLIYAIVGIAVVGLTQILIHLALSTAGQVGKVGP